MRVLRSVKRNLAAALAAVLLGMQLAPVQAAVIGTERLVAAERQALQRAELTAMLEREDVARQLQALGVDVEAARERVAALTDAEVARLNQRLAELPAGGVDAVGVILLVLLVFVITDIIGATDIFPFIHPVN